MTAYNLSSASGVTPGDTAGGSTSASSLNSWIASTLQPGDVLEWNCPISPDGPVIFQNKLGVQVRGAGAMGSRCSPNGNHDGIRWLSNESCVLADVGVAPKVVQTSGIGLLVDENYNSIVGLDNKFLRVNVFDRTRQQSAWSLGTGAPHKGVVVLGSGGGYKTRFDYLQVNGAQSNGVEVGAYNQSTRGPVGVEFNDGETSACGGDGMAVFVAEALRFYRTEALNNHGRGLVTYPDNGGTVELSLDNCLFDSNYGHGVEIDFGGSGAGGLIKSLDCVDTWFGNNGNPDYWNSGGSWANSCGITMTYGAGMAERTRFDRNQMVVNGLHGGVILGGLELDASGNRAFNNGQAATGGHGLFVYYMPTVNVFNSNIADGQAYGPYPARQCVGLGVWNGAAANATGNVSKNPNYANPTYYWNTMPNGSNNQ